MTKNKTGHKEIVTNHEKLTDFLNKNLKRLTLFIGVVVLGTALVIGFVLFREYKVKQELEAYQKLALEFDTKLMDISQKYEPKDEAASAAVDTAAMDAERTAAATDYAVKLIALADKSNWGYVADNGYYIAGGLYFTVKDYQKALENYLKAEDKAGNDVLKMLTMQQAAVCYEWLNKNDEAFAIYQKLEKKYEKTDYLDRILYDLGRMYQVKGDKEKAKEYFSKVIKNYSASVFAKKSQERILLLGSK